MPKVLGSENVFPVVQLGVDDPPATPAAGRVRLFADTDKLVYSIDDTGAVAGPFGDTSAALAAHLADSSDAHDASAISVLDAGALLTATDVEGALAELATIGVGGLAAHLADSSDAHDAAAVSIADSGSLITATDVEAALAELAAVSRRDASVAIILDGGGSAITTGVKGFIRVPFACTILGGRLLADQSGSIVVDVWKDTYANYPPVDADSITASAPLTISSATKSEDTTLTGWTTSIAAGDILGFNVDSVATVTRVTVDLHVRRT